MRWIVLLLILTACPPAILSPRGQQDPFAFSADTVDAADKIVIFIPGALSSIQVFTQTQDWARAGYARVYYRYPGLDGMQTDHHIAPAVAARNVADFANRYPDKDIVLVGYSTGGLIALEAAPQISAGRPVKVLGLSPAVEHAGGIQTIGRGARDFWRAATETRSVDKSNIWKRYWAGLLFGPDALTAPAQQPELNARIAEGEQVAVSLDLEMAVAHMAALPFWRLPDDLDLTGIDVAFFIGLNDPVFSTPQTMRFARSIGGARVYGYVGQGHLLFFTRPRVFRDMLAHAEGRDPTAQ